jgi:hypothetical protein
MEFPLDRIVRQRRFEIQKRTQPCPVIFVAAAVALYQHWMVLLSKLSFVAELWGVRGRAENYNMVSTTTQWLTLLKSETSFDCKCSAEGMRRKARRQSVVLTKSEANKELVDC